MKEITHCTPSNRKWIQIVAALSFAMAGPSAQAAPDTWNGTTTAWTTPGNWSLTAVPGASDIATFDSTTYTAQPGITTNVPQSVLGLQFGDGSTAVAAVTVSATAFASASTQKTSGTTSSGVTTVTIISGTGTVVGDLVTGTGIPAGTTVTGVSGNVLTISQPTSASIPTATQLTFTPTLTVGASGITVSAGIAGIQTISAPLVLGTSQAWTNNATLANGLTVSGTTLLGSNTLTINGASGSSTNLSGGIYGTGSVTIDTLGMVAISGANAFSGGLTLQNGTLGINSATAIGTGTLLINGGLIDSASTITLSNNNLQTWNGDFTFVGTNALNLGMGAVSLGTAAGTTRTVTVSAKTLTVGGAISDGTTAINLTKAGAGTLVLGGSNTYSGVTTVSGGTLVIGTGTAGDLGSNTANIDLSGGNLAFQRTNAGLTIDNSISGTGSVSQTGVGGTTVLTGANSYSGGTSVSNGSTLQAVANGGNTTSGVTTALRPNSGLTLNNTGGTTTVQLRADSDTSFTTGLATVNAGAAVTANTALVSTTTASTFTFDVGAATTASNHILTLGTLVADNTAGGTSADTINVTSGSTGYTLQMGTISTSNRSGTTFNFTFNPTTANLIVAGYTNSTASSGTLTFTGGGNTTFTGAITVPTGGNRTTSLVMNQTGTVTLNGSNILHRGTGISTSSLNDGTTVLNNVNALGGVTGTTNLATLGTTTASANNVTVLLGGTNATGTVLGTNGGITLPNNFVVQDTDTGIISIGGQNSSNTNTYSGTITLGATANTGKSVSLIAATGGEADFTNTILANGTDTTAGITVGDATGNDNGTVKLTAANTYGGLTTVASGTLLYGANDVISTGGVTVNGSSAVLNLGASHTDTVGTVTVDGGGSITGTGTSALTSTGSFEMKSGSVGVILKGTGIGLNKTTSGTVILSGANLYTGGTSVSAGNLQLASTGSILNTTTVTGGQVSGLGNAGDLALSGGTITPGDATTNLAAGTGTTLSASSLVWNSGGSLTFALSSTNSNSTLLDLGTGLLSKGTGTVFNINLSGGLASAPGTTYNLLAWTGTTNFLLSDFSLSSSLNPGVVGQFQFGTLGSENSLQFIETVVVPEPGTWAMMLGGLAFLIAMQRRRNKLD